jgi:serine/threonine protein kinase
VSDVSSQSKSIKCLDITTAWLFEMNEHYGVSAAAYIRGVGLLHDYSAIAPPSRADLQMVAEACMMLAAKFEQSVAITPEEMRIISDMSVDEVELCAQELHVIQTLDGRIGRPTAWQALEDIIGEECLSESDETTTLAKALLCVSATSARLFCLSGTPRELAEAAVCAACSATTGTSDTHALAERLLRAGNAAFESAEARDELEDDEKRDGAGPWSICDRPDYRMSLGMASNVVERHGPRKGRQDGLRNPQANSAVSSVSSARKMYKTTLPEFNAVLGKGTYGTVYSATAETGHIAIKSMPLRDPDPKSSEPRAMLSSTLVEVGVHLELNGGPGILELLWWHVSSTSLFVAYPVYDTDLWRHLHAAPITARDAQSVLRQLSSAVAFMHSKKFLHLDIKSSNVLVEPHSMDVRLCDFGIAEPVDPLGERKEVLSVQSLQYRAPEKMLGIAKHSEAMDIWSLGCVAIDVATSFCRAESDTEYWAKKKSIKQLRVYFKRFGTPTIEDWPDMGNLPLGTVARKWPEYPKPPGGFARRFPGVDRVILAFLESTLVFRPEGRSTAAQLYLLADILAPSPERGSLKKRKELTTRSEGEEDEAAKKVARDEDRNETRTTV